MRSDLAFRGVIEVNSSFIGSTKDTQSKPTCPAEGTHLNGTPTKVKREIGDKIKRGIAPFYSPDNILIKEIRERVNSEMVLLKISCTHFQSYKRSGTMNFQLLCWQPVVLEY
jgi:hypothetical protein